MADIIGVLGESSNVAIGTYTVYTVPAGKAAKGRFMYRMQAGAGGASAMSITMNGIVLFLKPATTANHFIFSGSASSMLTGATAPTGADAATTVAPGPSEYYLSAGDIMQYTIAGEAMALANVQFVGVEVDVT